MTGNTIARWIDALLILAALCLPGSGLARPASTPCDQTLVQKIPARPPTASSAGDFVRRVEGMSEVERETAIGAELLAGNMPRFLRRLTPITLRGLLPSGRAVGVTICVLPDYLAIGSDSDYLLIPMGLPTAITIASRYGFILPTRKMVDAIYAQSAVHLPPHPLPPGDDMRSTGYYWHHNELIREQRLALEMPTGVLTAGHKKDLVITNRLRWNPERVAIYGWHRANNEPIQPLSTWHGARYADYSHGVRLVSTVAYVQGKAKSIFELLEDRRLAPVLSDEGPMPHLAELMEALAVHGPDTANGRLEIGQTEAPTDLGLTIDLVRQCRCEGISIPGR